MTKILIAGDSFATDENQDYAWTQLLSKKYTVKNVAQAGISEYKILKQIEKQDLAKFDCIIVSHTSYSRIHVPIHPLHKQGKHKNCDLIYNDINRLSWFNKKLSIAKGWFEYYYDDDYQKDIYWLIRQRISALCASKTYVSISHLPLPKSMHKEENIYVNFNKLWQKNRGEVCHYNKAGNKQIFSQIDKIIETCL